MADYTCTSDSMSGPLEIMRMLANLRVAMPGIVTKFDAENQTVDVKPAIKAKVNTVDSVKLVDYPVIYDAPIVVPFAHTAGLLLTVPIQVGDAGLLVIADKAIDNYMQSGGAEPTGGGNFDATIMPRSHDLSDAIFIPGIVPNPQAVPQYSTTHIELRDRERVNYISLGPDGITITDGVAVWKMSGGKVTLDAPNGIEETSKANVSRITTALQTIIGTNINIGGAVAAGVNWIKDSLSSLAGTFIDKDNVNLNTHTHDDGPEPDK